MVESLGKVLAQSTSIHSVIKYIKNKMENNIKNTSGSTSHLLVLSQLF